MKIDEYGSIEYTENEICDALRKNPSLNFEDTFIQNGQKYLNAKAETFLEVPNINIWSSRKYDESPKDYHTHLQQCWLMPNSYASLNIEEWLLTQCNNSEQTTRVVEELSLYKKFHLINLLRYLKYLKDTADKNNIVWGVGRGSSCASYCLYLMKIHRVDALLFNLDCKEFLKEK